MSEAVSRAAKELKFTEEKATVILVSDGIETCDVDPCEVAKVKSARGKASAEAEISIPEQTEEMLRREVALAEEGVIALSAVNEEGGEAFPDVYWEVYEPMAETNVGKPKKIAYGRGATPEYKLLPGKYTAKAKSVKGQANYRCQ